LPLIPSEKYSCRIVAHIVKEVLRSGPIRQRTAVRWLFRGSLPAGSVRWVGRLCFRLRVYGAMKPEARRGMVRISSVFSVIADRLSRGLMRLASVDSDTIRRSRLKQ